MTVTRACEAREGTQAPGLRKICGDGILDAMDRRMDVITAFQPRGELRVRTAAAQIDDEILCDCHGAGLAGGLMNEMEHQVDAGSDAGARVALSVFNVETIFEN